MHLNDACSFGRPSSFRGMGRLFIFLTIVPETQKKFLRIHMTRMVQAAWLICEGGILRERFRLSAGDTTIRLQEGRKFSTVEKPQGLYLGKIFAR